MAIVKPTSEQLAERAELKRLMREQGAGPSISLSLSIAKQCGLAAGILYPYLQSKQIEQKGYRDEHNLRQGRRWIPSLTYEQIQADLGCFDSVTTIKTAANKLVESGLIEIESTGAFLHHDHITGRKRDIASWWRVRSTEDTTRLPLSVAEIKKHGIPASVILSHWRSLPEAEDGFKQLSAVEMAKLLPMDERTIRRHLKGLKGAGALVAHPQKPKLFRL